jgi:thioredoxin-related protein
MKKLKLIAIAIFSLSFFALNSCIAQEGGKKINWMSFEEAYKKNETQPRKIFIDVYTHWCGWCKRMDASTFQADTIVNYMNEKYYAVKLDAEIKDSIHFKDKVFVFRPEYKSNELAVSLLNGQMSYPSFVFLDENFDMLSPMQGYQAPEQLLPALSFYGENAYKTKKWDEYISGNTGGAK